MIFKEQAPFTKKVTDLPNTPSPEYTPAQIKEYFETPANELRTTVNKVVQDLNTDGWVDDKKIAPKGVKRSNIALGAIGPNELDPSIINQPKTEFEIQAKFDSVDSQLAQTSEQLGEVLHLSSFDKIVPEVDDTGRLQRAIDSFPTDAAGTILIHDTIRVSNKITINKTGLRFQGVGNKKSRIISSYAGVTLEVIPLINGNPYTNSGYCKFYMNDIALQAEGDAITSGTGLWLQWVFSSSFINLYTSGFAKHIVFRGSHLNTFYNLYQENADATIWGIEIHNRGVGLSADATQDAVGENTSNNNSFIGGWFHNTSFDFRNMPYTTMIGMNVEPASGTCYLGDYGSFTNNRFERFDLYAGQGEYPRFTWFEMGSHTEFRRNHLHQNGIHQTRDNPIIKVLGNNNKIEIDYFPSSHNLVTFEPNSTGNELTIDFDYEFNGVSPYEFYDEGKMIAGDNTIVYVDKSTSRKIIDYGKLAVQGIGEFTSVYKNIFSASWWAQDVTKASVDISLPSNLRKENITKITTGAGTNRRIVYNPDTGLLTASENGIYSICLALYVVSGTVTIKPHYTYGMEYKVDDAGKWKFVHIKFYATAGTKISPSISANEGTVYYVGDIHVAKGQLCMPIVNGVNPTYDTNKVKTNTIMKLNDTANIVPAKCGEFEYIIYDINTPANFAFVKGVWTEEMSSPIIFQIKNNVVVSDLVNQFGTIAVTGTSNYKVVVKTSEIVYNL